MQQEQKQLISIERVVAFVVGPAVIAASGWLSTLLARELGVHVSSGEIVAIFCTAGAGAAALVWKWLHGRQLVEGIEGAKAVQRIVEELPEGFLATTAHDLEGLAQKTVNEMVGKLGLHPTETPPAGPQA